MLISFNEILAVFQAKNIKVTGAFHVGAHECEELPFYHDLGLEDKDILWVEAMDKKVEQAIVRGIPNMYNAVITDKDDQVITFNISNNGQSSSVLEFGTHSTEHPYVFYIEKVEKKSVSIDTFFDRHNLDASIYNFWNFDIQGAELLALKGAIKSIKHAKALYLEVNEKELYKGCGLIGDIDEFLKPYGFTRALTHMTHYGWGDALFVRD